MKNLTFANPFKAATRWWKGNLHTHTTMSDGGLLPDETAAAYRKLGYEKEPVNLLSYHKELP